MDALDGGSTRSRSRRDLLRGAGVAGAFLLAGCTEDVGEEFPPNREWPVSEYLPELPVEERSAMVAERIEETADSDVEEPEDLQGVLPDDLAVETVERERDVLHVEYSSAERRRSGTVHQVGSLAGAYASLVESGYDAVALSISILDDAPSSYGVATVETPWAEAYNAGELTAKEYGEHVSGTIESKRHSPDAGVSPDE